MRQIAALARLRVPDAELPVWTRQLARIVSYIDQLKEIPEDRPGAAPELREATPLRDDVSRPGRGDEALEENAPACRTGFGVVPGVVGEAGRREPGLRDRALR